LVDEVNLAVWLLSEGLVSLAAEVADKELMAAEATTRKARLGLWSDSSEMTRLHKRRISQGSRKDDVLRLNIADGPLLEGVRVCPIPGGNCANSSTQH